MKTASVRPLDLVRCDRLGRRFWALVTGHEGGALTLAPVTRNVTYYRVSSREVLEHYARRPRPGGKISTRSIAPGDMVAYRQNGASVLASVLTRNRARLRVRPIAPGASECELLTREVTDHYARRGRVRASTVGS
jgi:hypothetical protein